MKTKEKHGHEWVRDNQKATNRTDANKSENNSSLTKKYEFGMNTKQGENASNNCRTVQARFWGRVERRRWYRKADKEQT